MPFRKGLNEKGHTMSSTAPNWQTVGKDWGEAGSPGGTPPAHLSEVLFENCLQVYLSRS